MLWEITPKMKDVTTVNIVEYYINYNLYLSMIELNKETSSLVYNGAMYEAVVTVSINSRKEVSR